MPSITIKLKDGTVREFRHEGRAGGSFTKRLTLEHGWAIVKDEWGKLTAFPASDVAEVEERPERGYW